MSRIDNPAPIRKWPVTANGILLLVEALFLIGAVAVVMSSGVPDLEAGVRALGAAVRDDPGGVSLKILRLPRDAIGLQVGDETLFIPEDVVVSTWHLPFVLPALLLGLLFLRLWRPAWAAALLLQALLLGIDLRIYYVWRATWVCLLMIFPIFMIVYLNHYDVRLAFQPGTRRKAPIVRDMTGDSL